jgi:two-component system nitrate/nitrite response regulator NarL
MSEAEDRRDVVIVEDDPLHASHLRRAVAALGQAVVAAELATRAAALALIGDERVAAPTLLVVDLRLPDGSGLDVLRAAAARWPTTTMVVTSALADEAHVVDAIRAGAQGYLWKDGDVVDLAGALRQALEGNAPMSPAVARHLVRMLQGGRRIVADDAPELTPREHDILREIAAGHSYADAATRLGVAVSTVETHVRHLYKKLQVRSKTQAVAQARSWGLL